MGMSLLTEFPNQNPTQHAFEREAHGEIAGSMSLNKPRHLLQVVASTT